MSAAERGIRLAAATLPVPMRERYREQWLADLRDAEELGLSRLAIVAGALAFSVGLGRSAEVRGYAVTELMMRRLRWGLALSISSPVALLTLWMTGAVVAEDGSMLAVAIGVVGVLSLLVLLLGFLLLLGAARLANTMAFVGMALVAGGLLGVLVPAALSMMIPSLSAIQYSSVVAALAIPVLLLVAVVGAFFVLLGFTRGLAQVEVPTRTTGGVTDSRTRAKGGLVSLLALTSLLAFGLYDLLVLSPLSQAPDYTLSEIYAMLSPGDRASGIVMIMIWLIFWAVASLALFVLCLLRGRLARALNVLLTPRRLAVYTLLLASVIIFFHGWAGFSLGMSIADTIPPYAGGRSWQAQLLLVLGGLMFVVGILRAFVPGPRRATAPTASGAPA